MRNFKNNQYERKEEKAEPIDFENKQVNNEIFEL